MQLFNMQQEREQVNWLKLQPQHIAVKRYVKKVAGKDILPTREFTHTDWLIAFVVEYNKVFNPPYRLPPMGAGFNALIHPFSLLIKEIPEYDRIEVFKEFIQNAKKGNILPHNWITGFTFEQMFSGYNTVQVKKEFVRIVDYVKEFRLQRFLPQEKKKNHPVQFF